MTRIQLSSTATDDSNVLFMNTARNNIVLSCYL